MFHAHCITIPCVSLNVVCQKRLENLHHVYTRYRFKMEDVALHCKSCKQQCVNFKSYCEQLGLMNKQKTMENSLWLMICI